MDKWGINSSITGKKGAAVTLHMHEEKWEEVKKYGTNRHRYKGSFRNIITHTHKEIP